MTSQQALPGLGGDAAEAPAAKLRVFNNELVEESLYTLSVAHQFDSADALRDHLIRMLPQNSDRVRVRNAGYISNRYFPSGNLDTALVAFARERSPDELRGVGYYHFCLAERLLGEVVARCFAASRPAGSARVHTVAEALRDLHPAAERSRERLVRTCIRTLRQFGVVTSRSGEDPVRFTEGPSDYGTFVYVLHHALGGPGMHQFASFCRSWAATVMLWSEGTVHDRLREMHARGDIAKLTEIDGVRQFTTVHTLDEAVRRLR